MLQNSARMKPSEYWVVPTATPLNLSAEWTMSGDFLNRVRAETSPSHVFFASGSKTDEPISNYLSPVKYAKEVVITADSSVGTTYSSGCSELGIVSNSAFASFLSGTVIPDLQSSGEVSPSQFLIFLVKNLVQSGAEPPTVSNCCILGFHTAQGSPAQTWGIMDYDTSGDFGSGTHDVSVSSHEIDEWMNDPLGNNATPAWGNIGQVSGCQDNLEVGDPLSGTLMPTVTLSGYTYHLQELAFFSWYFDKDGGTSYGAGGKFSGNGTFKGPSKACPPGGTY